MSVRTHAAILSGKVARSATRTLGRGGTALPGLIAERVDPAIVSELATKLETSVLVTGTNGKTTTARMLAEILSADGRTVVHNRAGSNLMRGITAALVEAAGPLGRLPTDAVAVFETDEATVPEAARAIKPRVLVVTNLMRDQLDRYGEIDAIRERWVSTIRALDRETTLVLNADDPSLATLAEHAQGPVVLYGIEDPAVALSPDAAAEHAADALWDPTSGADYIYERRFYAHLGHWQCVGVGRKRPRPDIRAVAIEQRSGRLRFGVASGGAASNGVVAGSGLAGSAPARGGPGLEEVESVQVGLSGVYNVYNAIAALAASRVLEVPAELSAAALGRVSAVFGRQEELIVQGHAVRILLGKNPAGMNEALRTLQTGSGQADQPPHQVLVLLN
ncbi:MAG TPA: Mur ligase family protein, partial [Dehalococcoidia bacterium]|nr:Mur ligase family protein [Dehalococcoidia bacterium]